jgi:hypothetical protein
MPHKKRNNQEILFRYVSYILFVSYSQEEKHLKRCVV